MNRNIAQRIVGQYALALQMSVLFVASKLSHAEVLIKRRAQKNVLLRKGHYPEAIRMMLGIQPFTNGCQRPMGNRLSVKVVRLYQTTQQIYTGLTSAVNIKETEKIGSTYADGVT
jgi:hypothetical protein